MLMMLLTIVFMLLLMFFGSMFDFNIFNSSGLALIFTAIVSLCLVLIF